MASPTVGTATIIAAARQIYDDKMDAFNKANLIERYIVQQLNTALDNDVLSDQIDYNTGLLVGTIPDIMAEIYNNYSTVTPQPLISAKAKLEFSVYNHSCPIANLFTTVNDNANMAEASGATETPEQLINIGLIVLTRHTFFFNNIRLWNIKTAT